MRVRLSGANPPVVVGETWKPIRATGVLGAKPKPAVTETTVDQEFLGALSAGELPPAKDTDELAKRLEAILTYVPRNGAARTAFQRVHEALTQGSSYYVAYAAAAELIPWEHLAPRASTVAVPPSIEDLVRASSAILFLLDSELPEPLLHGIHDLLYAARNGEVGRDLWAASLRSHHPDVRGAVVLAESDDPDNRIVGFNVLARTKKIDPSVAPERLAQLIEKGLTDENPLIARAAFDAACNVPVGNDVKRRFADLASQQMSGTVEDEPQDVLDSGKIGTLLAAAEPSERDADLYLSRCFGGTSTAEQHFAAIPLIGSFGLPAARVQAFMAESLKKMPESTGTLTVHALNFGADGLFAGALAQSLKFIADPGAAYGGGLLDAETVTTLVTRVTEELLQLAWAPRQGTGLPGKVAPLSVAVRALLETGRPEVCDVLLANWSALRQKLGRDPVVDAVVGKLATASSAAQIQFLQNLCDPTAPVISPQVKKYVDAIWQQPLLLAVVAAALPAKIASSSLAEMTTLVDGMVQDDSRRPLVPLALAQTLARESALAAEDADPVSAAMLRQAKLKTTISTVLETLLSAEDAATLTSVGAELHRLGFDDQNRSAIYTRLTGNTDPSVRMATATAIGKDREIKGPDALLLPLLNDAEPHVQAAALEGLSLSRVPVETVRGAVEKYFAAHKDSNDHAVLIGLARALAQATLPPELRRTMFAHLLRTPNPEVVAAAIEIIPHLGESEARALAQIYTDTFTELTRDKNTTGFVPNGTPLVFDLAGQLIAPDTSLRVASLLGPGVTAAAPTIAEQAETTVAEASVPVPPWALEVATLLGPNGKFSEAARAKMLVATKNADADGLSLQVGLAHVMTAQSKLGGTLAVAYAKHIESKAAADGAPVPTVRVGSYDLPVGHCDPDRVALVPGDDDADLVMAPTTAENVDVVAEAWLMGIPLWLEGPTSAGKTAVIRYLCAKLGVPFNRVSVNPFSNRKDLLGKYIPDPRDPTDLTKGSFEPGPVLLAMIRGECLLLDEMDLAPEDVLTMLNGLLDDRGEISIPGFNGGRPFKPKAGFRIFSTGNGIGMEGRTDLSEATLDRWQKIEVKGLTKIDIEIIAGAKFGDKIPSKLLSELITTHMALSKMADQDEIGGTDWRYAFTLRSFFRACRRFMRYRDDPAMDAILMRREMDEVYLNGIYDEDDRAKVLPLLKAVCAPTDDEVMATYGFKTDPSEPGLYLVEEFDDHWQLGDLSITKVNNGGADIPKFDRPFVLTKTSALLLYWTAKAIENHEIPTLVGGKGAGKTQVARVLAMLRGQDFFDQVFLRDSSPKDMIGFYGANGFEPQKLLRALTCGVDPDAAAAIKPGERVRGGALFFGDEILVGPPAIEERAQALGDGDTKFHVAEQGNIYVPVPLDFGAIFATNPPDYEGRRRFSTAWMNRVTMIRTESLEDKPDELKVIMRVACDYKGIPRHYADKLVDLQTWVNDQVSTGMLGANSGKTMMQGLRKLGSFLRYLGTFAEHWRDGAGPAWDRAFRLGAKRCYQFASDEQDKLVAVKTEDILRGAS